MTAGNDGFVGSSDFEVTPTPTPAALVVDFFATTDEPADVHAAAPASKATKRSSAASLLFQAFMDEPEPSAVPVPEPVPSTPFDDPPAFLAPSPAKAPTTPALIDIFNDDLVSAAPYNSSSTVAGAGSAPDPFGAASGKRNPLDVLSLYDMPAPTPAPKSGGNGMAGGGTGMSAAASISNIAVGHAGPMAMGGVHPASSAGAGFHCMSIGMSGKGVGAAAGPRGMPAGSMVGGMCTMQGVGTQQQGRGGPMTTPMNSPMGASFSPTGRMGGPGVGVGTSMGMGGAQSGHLALYQSSSIHSFGGGSSSSRAPTADPFDAINVLKK